VPNLAQPFHKKLEKPRDALNKARSALDQGEKLVQDGVEIRKVLADRVMPNLETWMSELNSLAQSNARTSLDLQREEQLAIRFAETLWRRSQVINAKRQIAILRIKRTWRKTILSIRTYIQAFWNKPE
jgi:hypothetical protein